MYASRTGTRRNLDEIRAAGWGLLISRAGKWRTEGFDRYAIDNGAWSDHQQQRPFDADAFDRLLDRLAAKADWVVLPDIVAGGLASLDLSLRWQNRCLAQCPMVLIAVQDGMTESDVSPFTGPSVGIFLGGSTPWKISNMERWEMFCRRNVLHYHVARVNTEKRIALAIAAGADSMDGTSATRFACTTHRLARAAGQPDLLTPGCPRPPHSYGLCNMHAQQQRRSGVWPPK